MTFIVEATYHGHGQRKLSSKMLKFCTKPVSLLHVLISIVEIRAYQRIYLRNLNQLLEDWLTNQCMESKTSVSLLIAYHW